MLRVTDCVAGSVWSAIQEPTEWQRIGNQIKAAMIFAGVNLVNGATGHNGVDSSNHPEARLNRKPIKNL